jgi:hypothetical protein
MLLVLILVMQLIRSNSLSDCLIAFSFYDRADDGAIGGGFTSACGVVFIMLVLDRPRNCCVLLLKANTMFCIPGSCGLSSSKQLFSI